MEKTIKIGDKEVRLDNNVGWALAYRDQFGKDIVPSLLPMIASVLDIVSGIIKETGKTEKLELADVMQVLDGDSLLDAVFHLGGLEFVDFINLTWALAKSADENIPEPREWVKQFDGFPVDVIGPAVVELVFKGVTSSKNWNRLEELKQAIQPNRPASTTSSSQDSNED